MAQQHRINPLFPRTHPPLNQLLQSKRIMKKRIYHLRMDLRGLDRQDQQKIPWKLLSNHHLKYLYLLTTERSLFSRDFLKKTWIYHSKTRAATINSLKLEYHSRDSYNTLQRLKKSSPMRSLSITEAHLYEKAVLCWMKYHRPTLTSLKFKSYCTKLDTIETVFGMLLQSIRYLPKLKIFFWKCMGIRRRKLPLKRGLFLQLLQSLSLLAHLEDLTLLTYDEYIQYDHIPSILEKLSSMKNLKGLMFSTQTDDEAVFRNDLALILASFPVRQYKRFYIRINDYYYEKTKDTLSTFVDLSQY